MIPIIDTHQHLWDLSKFELPWVNGVPIFERSYLPSDYAEATKDSNVVRSIYMEVDVAATQKVAEAEYIIDLCQRDDNPTCAAVISGYPADDGFREYITRFADSPYIKGIRQVLHVPETKQGLCLESSYVAGIQLLGELGLSFDLCMRPGELMDAVALTEQCPETQFILDHCGNGDPNIINGSVDAESMDKADPFWHTAQGWKDAISALAAQNNVVCKISGIVARAPEGWTAQDLAPTINHCLDSFGPDRVIFGGDWPVCTVAATYSEWASALREVISNRSDVDQRKLLHDNTVRIYGLG